MDSTTTSGILKIGLVFITFFTIPVYSEYCSDYSSSGANSYKYCSSSCCGTSSNRYCCSTFSTGYIVLIVIGCVLVVFICIACYCCRRRRAVQGRVLSNQGPMQHTVFQTNMIPTAPGQIIQMQPVQTPGFTGAPYIINQQPHFNPVIHPNMVPNPQVPTIASTNAPSNRNLSRRSQTNYLTPESSEPPPYEELNRASTEQLHVYEDIASDYQVNSGYEIPSNGHTPDYTGVYEELPDNRA